MQKYNNFTFSTQKFGLYWLFTMIFQHNHKNVKNNNQKVCACFAPKNSLTQCAQSPCRLGSTLAYHMKFKSYVTVPKFDGSNCDCSSTSVCFQNSLLKTQYNVNYNHVSKAIIRTPSSTKFSKHTHYNNLAQ